MYKINDEFSLDSFVKPDVSYAPVYVWVWNDICNCEIIDKQFVEMQNLGIRAFYILAEPKSFRPDSMPTNQPPSSNAAPKMGATKTIRVQSKNV